MVVTGGTREPVTELAEDHDIMIASVLQALDAAFNLYGIHWALRGSTPHAALIPCASHTPKLMCYK